MDKQEKNYHIVRKEIQPNEEITAYLDDICSKSNNLYNVTNYYIRQLYTGINKLKKNEKLFPNEQEIYDIVVNSLPLLDSISKNNIKSKINKLKKELKLNPDDKAIKDKLDKQKEKLKKMKPHTLPVSGFPSYALIEGVLKVTNNVDYRALSAKVAQQTMRQCFSDWNSFFASMKEYKVNPSKFTGKPKVPHYKKSGSKCKAVFDSQASRIHFNNETFTVSLDWCKERISFGNYIKSTEQLQMVEVSPFYDRYKISLVLKDENYVPKECEPTRIFGIDLGVDNFATISNNIGISPIIIKGEMFKSRNQYFNKVKAHYLSELQKGKDSSHSLKHSQKLYALSKKRENFFRDCFYKIAHRIVKIALENNIDTIVIGNNIQEMKQNINIGKQNNQTFVSIPFSQFISILKYLCLKNGIQFIETEESYTSKSSVIDFDILPVYKEKDKQVYQFLGKRITRGLYRTKDGKILNADVNGASNIIRKIKFSAFDNLDLSYLESVVVLNYKRFLLKYGSDT